MTKATLSRKPAYKSDLRKAQTELTREKIQSAAASLLEEAGAEGITFKAVAERAGVTEMTVYRHFPTRDELVQGLWRHLNAAMAPGVGMPETVEGMLGQHDDLYAGFDRIAPQILASITTPQGREMRIALNKQRKKAFLAIVEEAAPGLSAARKQDAAAVLQLLHSAYAWDSMRQHWGMNGKAAGKASKWAIEILLRDLGRSS